MPKARRVATRDHANIKLKTQWDRRQKRLQDRRTIMNDDSTVEAFARMWMQCDPNRGGSDPDEIMPQEFTSGSTDDGKSETHQNPLGGEPRWKWFIPRAEASIAFLKSRGLRVN